MSATAPKSAMQSTSRQTIKILYGESDESTISSQAAEIAKAGHQVTTVLDRHGIQEALRREAFDLVILGATMSKEDRHHLPYMVKKSQPGAKVLVMHAGTHHHEVDAAVDSGLSMPRILEKIAAMFHAAPIG